MTTFIESVAVEIKCSGPKPGNCGRRDVATIVSTVESGDLILTPVDWQATITDGQITLFCPIHKGKS